jgi:hypothetical protein
MKFMMIFKPDGEIEPGIPPCKQNLPEMATLVDELASSGVLIATEGLHPRAKGAHVRLSGGKMTVTDGPFAESKELIAGFALVEVSSKQAAVELAQRFLAIAGGGESIVRQVYEAPDYSPDVFPPDAAARDQIRRDEMWSKVSRR